MGLKLSWPVVSFKPHQCDQHLCCQNAWCGSPHTHNPSTLYFFTLYLARKLQKMHPHKCTAVSYSPILKGVSPVWSWASNGHSHFVALAQSHSPPNFVLLGLWWCTWPTVAPTTIQRGVLSVGVMRKSQFWWRNHEHPVCWFFTEVERDTFCNLVLHFIWFLPPTSPSHSSSPL